MKRQLILVKHSLPEMVETLPAREWSLSEAGCLRAEHLAYRLADYQPGRLFSSSEPKARETAEIFGKVLALPVHVVENLHEHDRSTVSFLAKEEFEAAVRNLFLSPEQLVFGSETANQACDRFSAAVDSILAENGNDPTVIVSHGTVISLFASRLTGQAGFEIWKKLGLPGFLVLDMYSKNLVAFENIP